MPSAWEELEKRLYDVLTAIKTPVPADDPDDPPGPPLAYLGNVHRHRPEHEHSSRLPAYFYADVEGGARRIRAWSVFANQEIDQETLNTTSIRLIATVRCWYEKGVGGVGVKLLQEHMSIYQTELRKLHRSLGGVVSVINRWSPVTYTPAANIAEKVEGEVIVGEFTIDALRGMGKI